MISAADSEEFIPHGRVACAVQPGPRPSVAKHQPLPGASLRGHPLVKAIQDISISESVKVINGTSFTI